MNNIQTPKKTSHNFIAGCFCRKFFITYFNLSILTAQALYSAVWVIGS